MSQSGEPPGTQTPAVEAPTTHGGENKSPMEFTLVVISPSNGVNGPLRFENTTGTTTVKELKAKIRDRVPSRPADDGQRLIHHGRLLSRETDSMLDIFGPEV